MTAGAGSTAAAGAGVGSVTRCGPRLTRAPVDGICPVGSADGICSAGGVGPAGGGASVTANCGYGRGFSVLEVLDAVDRVTNHTIERKLEGRRAGDPDSLISDNRRIKATLPWVPRYADLDVIVQHALAWERKLTEIRGEG